MVRTQIQLTESQAAALKRMAADRGVSMAEVIRMGAEQLIQTWVPVGVEERRRRALDLAGKFASGTPDLSTRHDDYLGEAYKS